MLEKDLNMFKINDKDTRGTYIELLLFLLLYLNFFPEAYLGLCQNICDENCKKKFMAPFYVWGSTASKLETLRGGSLLFTTNRTFLES